MNRSRFLERILGWLGRFVGRYPGRVLLGLLLVTAALAPAAWRTVQPGNIEHNLLNVLTAGMPKAEAYKRIGQDFGITDIHFLMISLDDEDLLPEGKLLADRLAAALSEDGEVVISARSRMDLKKYLMDHVHLYLRYLDEEQVDALAARFADRSMKAAMESNRALLRASPHLKKRVQLDPLDMASFARTVAGRLSGGQSSTFDPEGYIVAPDRRHLMVSVRPTGSGGDHEFIGQLMDYTRERVRRVRGKFFTDGRADLAGRMTIEIGGAYAGSQEIAELIFAGIIKSALVSFIGVLLLFALAYRRPAAFFLIGLPLAVPVIWTLAGTPLLLWSYGGRLSIIGGAFAGVLLGMGVDYAIHLYNRYVTERAAGASPERAAEVSVAASGEGIVLGAFTTVIAFAGMTLTDFRGFREFGAMAALGVFLTMIALLLGLPAALALISRLRGGRERAPQPFSLGLVGALRVVRRWPWVLVLVALFMLPCSLVAMFSDPYQLGVNFESDMAKMGPPRALDTVGEINREAARAFGLDFRSISVIIEGPTAESVMERTAEFSRRARTVRGVHTVQCVTDLVPAPSDQAASLELAGRLPLEDFTERLDAAAVSAGFRAGAFRKFAIGVERLAAAVRTGSRLDIEDLMAPPDGSGDSGPSRAVARELASMGFRAPDEPGGAYRTHSKVSLYSYKMEEDDYAGLALELGLDGRTACMTNPILVAYELKASVRGDLLMVTAAVAGVVLIMLLLALRRPVYVFLALSPVILGAAGLLLVMKLCGPLTGLVLELNYINVLVFPVLIGIGVDNAVHLVIRYRQDGMDVAGAVTETGRATVLCSLTTMLGFLSLTACPHWGIRSLGIVVAIGMGFVLLVSVFFVPAALELLARRAARVREGKQP